MFWNKSADDRAFLRELSREIVAAVAPTELDDFETQIARYFADPSPPSVRRRGRAASKAEQAGALLTPVVPAVLGAALTLVLMEIQEAAQHDLPEVIKLGLKRLLCEPGSRPHEQIRLARDGQGGPPALILTIFIYTLPVGVRVPLSRLADAAYETARIYGLSDASADLLVPIVLARLWVCPSSA